MNVFGQIPTRTLVGARVKRAGSDTWEDLGVIADSDGELVGQPMPGGGDSVKIDCPACEQRTPTGIREDDEGPVGFLCQHCQEYVRGDMHDGEFTVENTGDQPAQSKKSGASKATRREADKET